MAGNHNIQIAIIVVIHPRGFPQPDAGQGNIAINKAAVAHILIELGDLCRTRCTGDENVQITIVIIVAPAHRSFTDARYANCHLYEDAVTLILIEIGGA